MYLIADSNDKSNEDLTEDLQIEDVSALNTSPEQAEDQAQVLMDAEAAYADSVKKWNMNSFLNFISIKSII